MPEHATQAEHLTPSLTSVVAGSVERTRSPRSVYHPFLTSKGQWKTLCHLATQRGPQRSSLPSRPAAALGVEISALVPCTMASFEGKVLLSFGFRCPLAEEYSNSLSHGSS